MFKGTLVKSVRCKAHWETLTKLYLGLAWRPNESPEKTFVHTRDTNLGDHCTTSATEFNTHAKSSDIDLCNSDHKDLSSILKSVELTNLPEKTALLFQSQIKTLNSNPHARRWSPEIVRLCLTRYCRSPKAYQDLSQSGFLTLPSARQIQRIKNRVDQEADVKKEVLQWMKSEAEKLNIPEEGYEGG